jgi:hypothetical protein
VEKVERVLEMVEPSITHKILCDNIPGYNTTLANSPIHCLTRGIKRISGLIYEETPGVLKIFSQNLLGEHYFVGFCRVHQARQTSS